MRNKYVWMQILVLAALGIGVIVTLLPQLDRGRRNTPPVEISVLLREDISEGWTYTYLGMEQAAADLGGTLRVVTPEAWNNSEEQLALLQWEIGRGADALVVAAADSEAFAKALKESADAPPVVAIESPLVGAACSVLPENYDMGKMLAEALLEDWDDGVVVLLDSGDNNAGINQRLAGAKAVLEAAGLPIPVYGIGMTPEIAAGLERDTIQAVVAIGDYAAGYLAVENAINIAQGKTVESVTFPYFLVHKEDLHDTEMQKLLFPVDE